MWRADTIFAPEVSQREPIEMEATDKNCPHCGYALAEGASTCPCGLSLDDIDVPAPGIVRDTLERKLTLKEGDDGDLEEIEVEEVAPPSNSGERKKGRGERSKLSGSSASTEPSRSPERSRLEEWASESDVPLTVDPSPALEPARELRPVSVRAKSAEKSRPPRALREAPGRPRKNMMMTCPSCQALISKRAPKCPKCGHSPYRSCQICSSLILVNSAACVECGDPDPFLAQSA